MKPINYFFNGEQHTMGISERCAIERELCRPQDMPHCLPERGAFRHIRNVQAPQVRHTSLVARDHRRTLEAQSSPYEEIAYAWGVTLQRLKSWKSKKVITGPQGRVWKHCQCPAMNKRGHLLQRPL